MKKRLINILNGIADGLFPNVTNSIKATNDGREINRARLTASVLSWMVFIAALKGWVTWEQLVELLKMVFTID